MELIHKFVHTGPDGKEQAALTVERLWDGVYYLDRMTPSRNLGDAPAEIWVSLFDQALMLGRALNAKGFQLRTTTHQDSTQFIQTLSARGSMKKHDRIEFRSPIEDLPGDQGSPIEWKSIESLSLETLKNVGALIHQVGVGDPDYDPKDDPVAILKSYLADPVMTSSPNCIHLGYLEGRKMAIVIAQINPKTGWSRLTYMGMLPEFRGQGLGKWVHRHGFKMMREQGGTLYHGGTVSINERMLKLFQEHGCKEYRRMQEWIYRF